MIGNYNCKIGLEGKKFVVQVLNMRRILVRGPPRGPELTTNVYY